MKIKKLASMAGLFLCLAMAVPAYSDTLLYSFEDDDVEAILRLNPTTGIYEIVQSGPLLVGDVFYAVFEIPVFTIDGVNAIPAGQELTGVAAVQLTSIVGAGGVGTTYNFGSFSGLNTVLTSYGYLGPALPGGTAVAMFFNSTSGVGGDINLDVNVSSSPGTNCGSVAACTFQATLGSLFQVDGFDGDPDNFWQSVQLAAGGGDIGTVLGLSNTLQIAGFNFALGNLFNAAGPVTYQDILTSAPCPATAPIADGCAQFVGSGRVLGGVGLSGTGFIAHSDFDAQKNVIPEPATLSLLGLGLLGLGILRLRKK